MPNVISNGVIEDEERSGWALTCPHCDREVRYTILNVRPGEDVFLYGDKTSDFTLRDEDLADVQKIYKSDEKKAIDNLKKIYVNLENELPECPNGGYFKIWSNAKCPHCSYEFPYNNGVKNKAIRFMESTIIWVEGATAYRGKSRPSNHLIKVNLVKTNP